MKGKALKRTLAAAMAIVIVGGAVPAAGSGLLSVRPITANAESDGTQAGSVSFKNGKLTLSGAITADMLDEYRTDATSIVAAEGTVLPEDCSDLFSGFKILKTIDLSKADTSNVINMSGMFRSNEALESIDLSGFDTSNVLSMYRMFVSCKSLTSLDLSSFDTRKVVNMHSMFLKCNGLTSLDLSDFNTLSLKNAGSMFESCEQLETLDISSFDTSSIPDNETPYHMFKNCYALRTIYASRKADFSKFRIFGMFDGCKVLTGEMGTVIKPNNGVHVYSTNKYAHIDGGENDPGYFTYKANEDSYFDKETETLVLSGYVNKDNIDRKFLFNAGMNSKIKYIDADSTTVLPADCTNLFGQLSALEDVDFSQIKSSAVTSINGMFYKCTNLKTVDMTGFNTDNIKTMDSAFRDCSNLKTIYVGDSWNVSGTAAQGYSSVNMFSGCTSLVGGSGTTYNPDYVDNTYARVDEGASRPGYLTAITDGLQFNADTGVLYINGAFSESDLSLFKSSARKVIARYGAVLPESCNELFSSFTVLESVDLSRADFSQITSMRGMFKGSDKLTEVSWGNNAQTGNVTNMQQLFYNCSALKNPHTEQLNTGSVTSMYNMFYGCTSLEKLDLSSFSTSSVTSMSGMFRKCSALTTIIAGDSWNTEKVTSSTNMFTGCTALVGGIGTKYNSGKTDKTYARIDTVSEPGYLTANHPVVISNSMTLGGSISLNFYVAPSGLTEANLPKTYVVFDVNGKQQKVNIDLNKMNGKKTGYGFNCKLNSISMADEVKATIHYFDANGKEQTCTKTATCEQYLRKFNEQLDGGTKSWELIKGINDYGYYMQKYLSSLKTTNWVLGVDHKPMELAFRNHAYYNSNKAEYIKEIKDQAKSFGTNKNIEKVNYSLVLDSDTAINFKIKKKEGYTGKFTVTVDGKSVTPKKLTDGRFQVTVAGIAAHKLNEVHTVKVTTDSGTTTYKASAISYLYECISKPNSDLEFDAMCAMYEYYKAAVAYK